MYTNLLQGVLSITAKELGKQIGLSSISFGTNHLWMLLINDPSAEDQLKVMQKLDQVMEELKKVHADISNLKSQVNKFQIDVKMDMVDGYVNNIESLYDQYFAAINAMAENAKARYARKPNAINESKPDDIITSFKKIQNRLKELGSRITNETYKDLRQIHNYLVKQEERSLFNLAHNFYISQDFYSYFCAMKLMHTRYFLVQKKALDMLNLVLDDSMIDFPDGKEVIKKAEDMVDQQEERFLKLVPDSVVQLVNALSKNPERASVRFQANTGRGIHFGSLLYGNIMTCIGDLAEEWYLEPMQPIINPNLQQKYSFRLIHSESGKSLIFSGSQYVAVASDDTTMGWQIYCAPNGKFWLEFKGNYYGGTLDGARLCINPSNRGQLFYSTNKNKTDTDQQFTLIPFQGGFFGDTLKAREYLIPGCYLESQNGKFRLIYNEDSSFGIYRQTDQQNVWKADCVSDRAWRLAMQNDGNFVAYSAPNKPYWSSGTYFEEVWNYQYSYLRLTNQGQIELMDKDGTLFWSSGIVIIPLQSTREQVAWTIFSNKLYLAFKATDSESSLCIASSSDGVNWSNGNRVPRQSTSAGPALAVFNNKLYLAFKATDSESSLCIASSSDGVNWSDGNQVPRQSTSAGPALAVFNNKLYLAFKATDSESSLCIACSSDGVNWSNGNRVPRQSTSAGPALAVFNNNLLLGWTGRNQSINLMQLDGVV